MTSLGRLLEEVRGLQWPTRRPIHGGIAGTHHSRLRGTAPELAEYRLYRQGDEARRIDWKLLARSDRAYIRLAPDKATLRTLIVADASASMRFPEETAGKWQLARDIVLGLAAVAHAGGDPVGVVVNAAAGPLRFAPRSRRGVLPAIARLLDGVVPGGSPPALAALDGAASVPRIAIVSDLLGDTAPLLRWVRTHVVAGGVVHLVHIVAAEELDPPERAMTAVDPEPPGLVRPFDDRVRERYLEAFGAWRDDIARASRDAGAEYVMVSTGERPARAVRRIVTRGTGAAA